LNLALSPARRAAFHLLLQVDEQEAHLSELIFSPLLESLEFIDRNLATELVYGVLRQQRLLDHLLASSCRPRLSTLDKPVLLALRLGAYQLLFLTRIPPHAAVNESVELVKWQKLRSAAPLVNAILRRITHESLDEWVAALERGPAENLALRFSHPDWLVERWRGVWGEDQLRKLLALNNQLPPVFFRSNSPRIQISEIATELENKKIRVSWSEFPSGCGRILEGDLRQTKLWRDRQLIIQDRASQMVPLLLEPRKDDLVLDLCAAPGGKASEMAWHTRDGAKILAMDCEFSRLCSARKIHAGLWRNLHFVGADGTQPLPFRVEFNKILVDAPCSGTGTLRKNPDIRWKLRPDRLLELQGRQISLLENASRSLRTGGTIVYSTCSMEPEENEQVVELFLEHHPDFRLTIPTHPEFQSYFHSDCYFRILPSEENADGFFAAVLVKLSSN
jgi:16S rRNA (cytosine967-C5)-methyltransferase